MAQNPRRPLAILRLDTATSATGGGGVVDSNGAPAKGWDTLSLHMRLPGGGGTLDVLEKLRSGSTYVVTFTIVLAGIGNYDTVLATHAEHIRVRFTNGGVAQQPEIIATLS